MDVKSNFLSVWTPLHEAAQQGHRDLAEFLIAKGANVNAATKAGMTPLQMAKSTRHEDVGELLRQYGAEE
jgi:ankyrin repeat protein